MQLQTIEKAVRFLVFGDNANTQYASEDIKRNINIAYRKWLTVALQFSGKWQVRGTYAYIDLEEGVYKYDIDADILKFNRVEAKLTVAGEYQIISPIDIHSTTSVLETHEPALPEYDLRDGYLTIYTDQDIEDVTDGLKVYVNRDLTDLVDTTDEPDLAEPFLDLIIADAGLEYCLAHEMTTKEREIERKIDKRRPDFESFYSTRSPQPTIMKPKKVNRY